MRRERPTLPSPVQGYTLVELLIAITLFALLSVMLFGGLRLGTRAAEGGTARLERSAELAVVTNFLRRQLADAQPLPITTSSGQTAIAFTGEPDNVEFVGLPPAHLALGGWHILHLGMERQEGRGRVMLRWRVIEASDEGLTATAAQSSVLLDNVKTAEFGYFGSYAGNERPEWHDRWQGIGHLPFLLRLRLVYADGQRAPDLIVALRTAGTPPPQ